MNNVKNETKNFTNISLNLICRTEADSEKSKYLLNKIISIYIFAGTEADREKSKYLLYKIISLYIFAGTTLIAQQL